MSELSRNDVELSAADAVLAGAERRRRRVEDIGPEPPLERRDALTDQHGRTLEAQACVQRLAVRQDE
jgi:hypothetical protein